MVATAERPAVSEAARLLSHQRRQVAGACVMCGASFVTNARRVTCSNRCRKARERRRHAVQRGRALANAF